jgi:hypothetical protein
MMKKAHDSLLVVAAVVGTTMISFFVWPQERNVRDSQILPSGFVMKFERNGGYAGVHDSFWIYPDGRVINAAGKIAKISPAIVREWRKNIMPFMPNASVEFSTESLCFDCFVYRITIYDRSGTKTLKLSEILNGDSDTLATTFIGMRERLLHLVWVPLTGAPVQDGRAE